MRQAEQLQGPLGKSRAIDGRVEVADNGDRFDHLARDERAYRDESELIIEIETWVGEDDERPAATFGRVAHGEGAVRGECARRECARMARGQRRSQTAIARARGPTRAHVSLQLPRYSVGGTLGRYSRVVVEGSRGERRVLKQLRQRLRLRDAVLLLSVAVDDV